MHEIAVSREKTNLGHRNAASLIRTAAEDALRAEGIEVPCLISVMLTDGEGIREINREFRGIDRETDVLSFPLNELQPGAFDPSLCERDPDTGEVMLGDMMISLPACERQGEEYGHGFTDGPFRPAPARLRPPGRGRTEAPHARARKRDRVIPQKMQNELHSRL